MVPLISGAALFGMLHRFLRILA
jgi:hypothetical protein